MNNFGINRVIEPENTVPVTAWKLDNSRKITPDEIRISIDRIHVEWDSFQQICTSCGYDDSKVRARILDIIDKRGKKWRNNSSFVSLLQKNMGSKSSVSLLPKGGEPALF